MFLRLWEELGNVPGVGVQAATQTLCPSASIWGWDCEIGSEAGNSEAVSKAWRDTQQNALVLQIPPYALPQPKKKKSH